MAYTSLGYSRTLIFIEQWILEGKFFKIEVTYCQIHSFAVLKRPFTMAYGKSNYL